MTNLCHVVLAKCKPCEQLLSFQRPILAKCKCRSRNENENENENEKGLLSEWEGFVISSIPSSFFQLVNVHVLYLLCGCGRYAKLLCVVAVTFRRNSVLMQACEHFKDPLAKCKCRSRNENEKGLCYLFYSCLLIPVSPLLHIFLFVGSARIDAIAMHNWPSQQSWLQSF